MTSIIDTFQIKNLTLKNRIMRSATTSYWSNDEGILRQPIIDYYQKLVKGGLGFIVKGHSYIMESGKAHTGQSGLTNEKHLPKMKELTNLANKEQIPIIAQINHAGSGSIVERVTASEYVTENWTARELTVDEIELIVENFANSAELAIQANFDGIQIHSAHGYLVSQFLSDNVNRRQDAYGGSLKNRAKLLFDIYDAIKKKIGNAPIISIKMNCDDFAPEGGIRIADAILIANWLDEKGIDLIEISGGGQKQDRSIRNTRGKPAKDSEYFEANFAGHAESIRKAIPSVPLALVDGFRTKKAMNAILSKNIVDLISISKPTIAESDLPNKLLKDQDESACIDCRECLSKERFGKMMLSCVQQEKN
jgi:2,4-dienoyl-CoA reductase-like NADH-dependent reductase (Old Yellow Enzyme family)